MTRTVAMDDSAGGRDATKRQCAVTRIVRPVDDLVRFVADPEGRVVPDLKRTLPGRGVSVTAARDLIEAAVRRKVFARALRRPVEVDGDLPQRVERLLVEAALGRLALANKAGEVVSGFGKVAEAIDKGRLRALVHAADAAADGRRKLDGRARGRGLEVAAVTCLAGEELSLALGRPNVIHAAVTGGGASEAFLAAAARVDRFRAGGAAFAAA